MERVTLRFSGNDLSGLHLHDNVTGTSSELYDGMEYQVTGNVSGRLFLTSAPTGVDIVETGMRWEVSASTLTVTSANAGGLLSVRLHDMKGATVVSRQSEGGSVTVSLRPGIYLMEAEDGVDRICRQILVK